MTPEEVSEIIRGFLQEKAPILNKVRKNLEVGLNAGETLTADNR